MSRQPPALRLVVAEGGRADLCRQMVRAVLEHRYAQARALARRLGHRASMVLAPADADAPDTARQAHASTRE